MKNDLNGRDDRDEFIHKVKVTSLTIILLPIVPYTPLTLGVPENTVAAWAVGVICAASMLLLFWVNALPSQKKPESNRHHWGAFLRFLVLLIALPVLPPGLKVIESRINDIAQSDILGVWALMDARHGGSFAIRQIYAAEGAHLHPVANTHDDEVSSAQEAHGITAHREDGHISITVPDLTHSSCARMATLSVNDQNNIRTRFPMPGADGKSDIASALQATAIVINGKHRLESGNELPSEGRLMEMCEDDGQQRIESATFSYILEPIELSAEEVSARRSSEPVTLDSVREACSLAFEQKDNDLGVTWLITLFANCYSDLVWLSYWDQEVQQL